jgi:acylphosphatase
MCGEKKNIDNMLKWLEKGPPEAQVVKFDVKQVPFQEHNFFSIG